MGAENSKVTFFASPLPMLAMTTSTRVPWRYSAVTTT